MRRLAYKFFDGLNFVTFVKPFPHLRGHVTDLLIDERLDEIIEPLKTLRAEQEAASSKKTKKKTATRIS